MTKSTARPHHEVTFTVGSRTTAGCSCGWNSSDAGDIAEVHEAYQIHRDEIEAALLLEEAS